MSTRAQPSRSGFTFIELMTVVVIVGVISVSALPAIDQLRDCRAAAARSDVRSLLRTTRAHAMATGDPCGLAIDLDDQTLQLLLLPPGGTPEPLIDALGAESEPVPIATLYPGVAIASCIGPDGSAGSCVIWFANTGALESREDDGELIASATDDAEITVGSFEAIIVDHRTGRIY